MLLFSCTTGRCLKEEPLKNTTLTWAGKHEIRERLYGVYCTVRNISFLERESKPGSVVWPTFLEQYWAGIEPNCTMTTPQRYHDMYRVWHTHTIAATTAAANLIITTLWASRISCATHSFIFFDCHQMHPENEATLVGVNAGVDRG